MVFGKKDGFKVNLSELDDAGNDEGVVILGAGFQHRSGFSVANAGDLDGDGLEDVISGTHGATPAGAYSGAAYVVFAPFARTAVWVDFANNTGVENGTFPRPYNTLAEGIANVPERGTIHMKAYTGVNDWPHNPTLNKPLTIESHGGKIRIGAS